MKYGVLAVDTFYYGKNEIFNIESPMNQDNRIYCYHALRERFRAEGIELVTQDMCPSEPEFIIFNDQFPDKLYNKNQFLIMWECEGVSSNCWIKDDRNMFRKIFSWYPFNDDKYVRMYWPIKIEKVIDHPKTKEMVMVCNLKTSPYYKENYSARYKAMDYFGDRLDVFGNGRGNAHWKGQIDNKLETMKDYKFAFAYENALDIPGYCTEKIFDAMFAGCVPIYMPNPDIDIPEACYINSQGDNWFVEGVINDPMNSMIWRDKLQYIKEYLPQSKHNVDHWVETLVSEVLGSLVK